MQRLMLKKILYTKLSGTLRTVCKKGASDFVPFWTKVKLILGNKNETKNSFNIVYMSILITTGNY